MKKNAAPTSFLSMGKKTTIWQVTVQLKAPSLYYQVYKVSIKWQVWNILN